MRLLVAAFLLVYGLAGAAGAQESPEAVFAEVVRAATGGNAESQYLAGILSATGQGTAKDYGAAAQWFHKAALAGHPMAQANLGTLYTLGLGVARDLVVAYSWYLVALEAEPDQLPDIWQARVQRLERRLTPGEKRKAEELARQRRSEIRPVN